MKPDLWQTIHAYVCSCSPLKAGQCHETSNRYTELTHERKLAVPSRRGSAMKQVQSLVAEAKQKYLQSPQGGAVP